ncbi:redoxin domain-containing protein [Sphingobacterium sp. SRCM116780]|uniref:redoxin domain-containing protein n=1 Tax=Sphingobacterium sp. SRCM116780 TaxID=2907623 RepID=UPI001F3FB47B|nr:redoxin domain-containing protein [Sphingobacterium sp. SRCM116780]UIR56789.1 redoxin domain-containing protein [Sphingobacterium sp. SRCM116780]
MKKIYALFLVVLFFNKATSQGLHVQDKFPIHSITGYQPANNLKLVAFIPSLYLDCEYASMLSTSFHYYFVQGLAFPSGQKPKIDIILVVNDKDKWTDNDLTNQSKIFKLENRNILDSMKVIYDETGYIYTSVGLPVFRPFSKQQVQQTSSPLKISSDSLSFNLSMSPEQPSDSLLNKSSVLFLLDADNKILFKDTAYRAQGEHLKPLENYMKQFLSLTSRDTNHQEYTMLKIGDKAPDFILKDPNNIFPTKKLLDDKEKWKIITFYPAAFSGTLPSALSHGGMLARIASCSAQIQSFDKIILGSTEIRYAISSSTMPLLKYWGSTLQTYNTVYLNDEDYEIAKQYNAYNKNGYNNRLTYIIAPNGIIKYIDLNYTNEDEQQLPEKMRELTKSKK